MTYRGTETLDRRRHGKQYARARRRDDGQPRQWRSDLGRFDDCDRLPEHRRLGAVLGPHLDGLVRQPTPSPAHPATTPSMAAAGRIICSAAVATTSSSSMDRRWHLALRSTAEADPIRSACRRTRAPFTDTELVEFAHERAVDRLHREQRRCNAQSLGQPDQPDIRRRVEYTERCR